MMARNPSATQPRDADGRYASNGRPSKRDRSWRTEPGYEDTSQAEDTEPDTPSDAKADRKRPATTPTDPPGRVRAAAQAAGGKVRDGHNRRMKAAASTHAARKAQKAKGVKPRRDGGTADRFAHRAVKGLARRLATTVDNDRPVG